MSPNHPDYNNIIEGSSKSLKNATLITSFLDTPEMRPSMQRLRDRFQSVWEVSSLSLRVHLVDQGLGAAFIDSKLLEEHPVCREFTLIKGLPFSTIERRVGLYYKTGKTLSPCTAHFADMCKEFWQA